MRRLLVTGGSGLLGLNWACCMRGQFDVMLGMHHHTVNLSGTSSIPLNLDSLDQLTEQLQRLSPDLVIHTAGLTSVDQCERAPALAEQANTTLAQHVAVATHAHGIKLVHISTDHLFSGARPLVPEEEEPQPLNVYARTKLQAEKLVGKANPEALIIRTNFFGWGHTYRQSISDWIISNLRSGQGITMFDDVFFTPILADDLAIAVHEVLERGGRGIYHVVGEERISKFEFANCLATQFGLPKVLINRGQIGMSSLSAARPHDMSLDNTRVRGLLGRNIGSLDEFLKKLCQHEERGRAAELKNAVMGK